MPFVLKRVYEEASADDGLRVLVDRLWPRGLAKARAGVDIWHKDIAPSTPLRQWFAHDPAQWQEFRQRYFAELDAIPSAVEQLRLWAKNQHVTLLYAAKNAEYNNAVALLDYLHGAHA